MGEQPIELHSVVVIHLIFVPIYISYLSRFTFHICPGLHFIFVQVYISYLSRFTFNICPGLHFIFFQVYIFTTGAQGCVATLGYVGPGL